MSTRIDNFQIGVALAVLICVVSAMPVRADQTETPIACVEGPDPVAIAYSIHTTGCAIDTTSDIDQFTFSGFAGDDVRMIVRSNGNSPDPRLEVRDPSGLVISDTNCGTTTSLACSLVVNLSLASTGQYQLAMSDAGSNGTGNYTLQLEKIPPDLFEALNYGPQIADSISPSTDLDSFGYSGNAGTVVRLTFRGLANSPDPFYEILDPTGAQIATGTCGATTSLPCTVTQDLSLSIAGAYRVLFHDAGYDGTGSYTIGLECLFGDCPDPIPDACDIEMSQASYTLGETVSIASWQIGNPTNNPAFPLAIEWKTWFVLPSSLQVSLINSGADGGLVLPAGFSADLGPLDLFTVTGATALGSYELNCRILIPVSGGTIKLDENSFEIE